MNFIVKLTYMGDERFAYKIQKEEIEIIKKVYYIKEYLAMTVMSKKQMRKEGQHGSWKVIGAIVVIYGFGTTL